MPLSTLSVRNLVGAFAMSLAALISAAAVAAADLTPGISLLEVLDDPQLDETLYGAGNPVISPDGKHLYLHRDQSFGEEAMISVLGLTDDDNHSPFYIRSYDASCCNDEDLVGPNLIIAAFNSAGTVAYATFGNLPPVSHQYAPWGIVVLKRDPTTGDLTELQRISMPEFAVVFAKPVVSGDGRHLYVSYRGGTSGFISEPELRAYELQPDTGLLASYTSVVTDPADPLTSLTLIDGDSRLLTSSENALIEYQRDTATGELTQLRTTPLPALPVRPDGEPRNAGPVAVAVTSDGRSVYTLLQGFNGSGGGAHLNTFIRNPDTGELSLLSQLAPGDIPSHGLYAGRQLILNQAEDVLLATSRYARYFAGSPSDSGCVDAFARDTTTGQLRIAGYQCDTTTMGFGWASFPGEDIYYTNASQLRTIIPGFAELSPTQLAVWEPGRIAQPTNIHAAILPTSRSLGDLDNNDEPVTYFTSVLNPGSDDALQCVIDYNGALPIALSYQINDLASNEPINPGRFDREFEVPAGGVAQLLLTVYAFSPFATTNIELDYSCVNTANAPTVQGVTTVLLSSSAAPLPDLITGTATVGNTGVSQLSSRNGSGFFTVSTINIGAADVLRAVPVFDLARLVDGIESGGSLLDATLRICETDPATGVCLAPASAETARRIDNREIATYTVFIQGNGSDIALDPARNRVFIAFLDSSGEVRGASSVAVTTAP